MRHPILAVAAAALCLSLSNLAWGADPVMIHVSLAGAASAPVSGRLLIFAKPLALAQSQAKGGAIPEVDAGEFNPRETAIAAEEVHDLAPGQAVALDADLIAFPQPFSKLAPGRYAVQAVLDRDHSYNYGGRGPGDLLSPVTVLDLPAGGALELTQAVPPPADPWTPPASASAEAKANLAAAKANTQPIDFVSPALTRFWGRPIHMHGWVLTPPRLRRPSHGALSDRLLHHRLWRDRGWVDAGRGLHGQRHGHRRCAADDLGPFGRVQPNGHA
jgi:hypothetical protein